MIMHNLRSALLLSASLACLGEASAQGVALPFDSFLTVGGNYTRVNFKPKGDPSFNGNMGGVHGKYEYRPENAIYAAIELDWRQGSMDGSAGKRTLCDVNTAEKIGYTWSCDCLLFTAYTGFGFRYLGHHFEPSSSSGPLFNGSFFPPFLSSSTSLKFRYYEFYAPLGFLSEYDFNSWFSVGVNFQWMPQIFPTVKIEPLGGACWDLSYTFGNFLVEVPFNFNLTQCGDWTLSLIPFYERWQDGHSTAKTSGGIPLGLPENTYNFYGVDLNVTYSF